MDSNVALESQKSSPRAWEKTRLLLHGFSGRSRTETSHNAIKPDVGHQILQDGHPTIIPTFTTLRQRCMKRTVAQIRSLERQIEAIENGVEWDDEEWDNDEWNALVERARTLLDDLDKQLMAVVEKHQLEDPQYAASRGISLTHFNKTSPGKRSDWEKGSRVMDTWMVLTSDWSSGSRSLIETQPAKLDARHKSLIQRKCRMEGDDLPQIAFKRPKNVLERQKWAVRTPDETSGSDVLMPSPNARWTLAWGIFLALIHVCLFIFLGTAVIATTTKFSKFFVKTFYWIAIIWTMAASTLLLALVRMFGGDSRDCLSAFLASVAIYLVVIQIGQTRLNIQDPDGTGVAFSGV